MSTGAGTGPIVVGVDGSAVSKVAVDWAARDAAMKGLDLTLVHMLNPPVVMAFPEVPMPQEYLQWQEGEARKILDAAAGVAAAATKDAAKDITISHEMLSGPPIPALIEASKGAHMIVVGCRGRGALARGLLGSVSNALVHHALCPVAVIHDEDPLMPHPSEAAVVVGV
ncbi:MAG: universal stress protein, partial [Mycobacterium sp.]|nr:universal stress protein [Mycobacterium sp.]